MFVKPPVNISPNEMEVESSYSKYAGRVPPLDLSEVNSISSTDSEEMWNLKTEFIRSSPHHLRRPSNINHPYYDIHRKLCLNIQKHPPKNANFINTSTTTLRDLSNCDELPLDPRDWTRTDVWRWLICMAVSEGLEVTSELTQKFPMNGKALCLMSLDMYLSRVPVGGKMLYRDFRVRLAKAMSHTLS